MLGLERYSGEMTRFAPLCKAALACYEAEAEAVFSIGSKQKNALPFFFSSLLTTHDKSG